MFAASEAFSPSTVRTSTCWPPSPCKSKGSRGTPTGAGLSIRPSPDRLVGSAEARASSTAHSSHQHRMATQPEQAYNLCLSEMRHYQDDDTMVLVLSQRAGEVQEAEYPVPLEQDTSEILDAEDDDVLAGYAEAASKLLRPNPLTILAQGATTTPVVSPVKRFNYDDVSHERFDSETYEAPAKQKLQPRKDSSTSSRKKNEDSRTIIIPEENEHEADTSPDSNRVLFSSTDPVLGPSTWAPAQPVVEEVDDEPTTPPQSRPSQKSSSAKKSSSSAGHRLHHESHPSGDVRVSNGASPPKRDKNSKKKSSPEAPKPFFPSSYSSTAPQSSGSGATAPPPRSPDDNFQHTAPREHTFYPSSPVSPRVSNGAARPKVSNGMSKKTSRAEVRERTARIRAGERAQLDTQSPPEPASPSEPALPPSKPATSASQPSNDSNKVRGFWDPAQQPSPDAEVSSPSAQPRMSPEDRHAERLQDSTSAQAKPTQPAPAQPAQPFFPQAAPSPSRGDGDAHTQFEWSKPKGVRDFFAPSPTSSASAPAAEPTPAVDNDLGGKNDRSNGGSVASQSAPSQPSGSYSPPAASPQRKPKEFVAAADAAPHIARRSPGYLDVDPDETDQEVDTKDKKGLAIEHEHHDASRSFARAVSISSLETVVPEHSVRGRSNSPRNSAMRRSSRRDAHMKARIATLDTSNLSAYSSSTLRRLAKDLGLSNTYKLSKSELVVQLVSEIILANMSLGWSVPEVSQGALTQQQQDDGYSSSDDEDATLYRFEEDGRHRRRVSVEEAVPHDTLQRGREGVERLNLDHGRDHAAPAQVGESGVSTAATGGPAAWQQVDVDSDFENMSKLSMSELQQMCEDMKIQGWSSMRKFEMISSLLMDVYEIEK